MLCHANDSWKWFSCRSSFRRRRRCRLCCKSLATPRPHEPKKHIWPLLFCTFIILTYTYTYTHTHRDTRIYFGLRFLSETVEQASPIRIPICIREAALIGADGVIYINVCHFSSFAQFAFHFFGSLNCRRHVIYWPYWADSRSCPRPRPAWPGQAWPGLVSFTADLVMDFFGFCCVFLHVVFRLSQNWTWWGLKLKAMLKKIEVVCKYV